MVRVSPALFTSIVFRATGAGSPFAFCKKYNRHQSDSLLLMIISKRWAMQYQDFMEGVKKSGNFSSIEETEVAVEASLSTLAERLHTTVTDKFQSQLPNQLKKYLAVSSGGIQFSLEEYYNRVGARARIRYSQAVRWSRAVMSAVNLAITAGLKKEILDDLPAEFVELFGQEPTTPLSPTVTE
jgi:uncharacterized protein (DUF2267 family)